MAEFVTEGFRALAGELGRDVVGEPVEDENYLPGEQYSVQTTTRGVMWYSKGGNQPGFLPFASTPAATSATRGASSSRGR